MAEFQPISPSERQVLRVIWANPHSTSNFIIEQLQKSFSWSESTIKTLILRLTKKGYIQIEKRKKPFHYIAIISEPSQLDRETDILLDQICNQQHGKLIKMIIDKATLSQADIKTLLLALQTKAKKAPTTISCDCLPGQCHCHHDHH